MLLNRVDHYTNVHSAAGERNGTARPVPTVCITHWWWCDQLTSHNKSIQSPVALTFSSSRCHTIECESFPGSFQFFGPTKCGQCTTSNNAELLCLISVVMASIDLFILIYKETVCSHSTDKALKHLFADFEVFVIEHWPRDSSCNTPPKIPFMQIKVDTRFRSLFVLSSKQLELCCSAFVPLRADPRIYTWRISNMQANLHNLSLGSWNKSKRPSTRARRRVHEQQNGIWRSQINKCCTV